MSESIYVRIRRIIKANIEDAIDSIERAGGTTVLRQAVRELDAIVEEAKRERDQATARRLQAVRQRQLYTERLDSMMEKAEWAMKQGREDLAEASVLRQMEFEQQIENLKETEAKASEQEHELEAALATLEIRKAQMEDELAAIEEYQAEAGELVGGEIVDTNKLREKRAERAEATFDRIMKQTTGSSGMSIDIETSKKLGELDQMQKRSKVEDRMAELRKKMAS